MAMNNFSPEFIPHIDRSYQRNGLRDWWDLVITDHGFLRGWFWTNFAKIDDKMWRGNQPGPRRIRWLAEKGVRTIINLRGPRDDGTWQLEAEACHRLGLTLVDFRLRSRDVPQVGDVQKFSGLLQEITFPAFMHCKSGADRAGLGAALYLLTQKSSKPEEAAAQLSLRFGHFRQAKTGLLDAFVADYAKFARQGVSFETWLEEHYDPDALKKKFLAQRWANHIVDHVLRRE